MGLANEDMIAYLFNVIKRGEILFVELSQEGIHERA